MHLSRRDLLRYAGSALALSGLDLALPPAAQAGVPAVGDPHLHFLNRISYGARPAELATCRRMGISAYLAEQLTGAALEDQALKRKMNPFRVLNLTRKRIYQLEDPWGESCRGLVHGAVTRAVYSRAQLFERVCEFWSDHFNIAKDGLEVELVIHQREVIRRYAFTTFYELLVATARSPAMLYYLDNYLNIAANPNENYGREVLELHGMGVDGGYTETDVREAARAFTGWTADDKKGDGNFFFDAANHDTGAKTVLGRTLPAGRGIEDGMDVLRLIADHPSTARYVCRKLAARFVSDTPPVSLVDAMAKTWGQTGGSIKAVLQRLFLSPEFAQSAGLKLRRPLDLAVGAMRAAGTDIYEFYELEWLLETLAQIPYNWGPPNGYPEPAAAWVNTQALLARWNAMFELTEGAYLDPKGMTTRLRAQLGRPLPATVGALVAAVSGWVFGKPLSDAQAAPFVAFASDGAGPATRVTAALLQVKLGALYGLMLSSPAYQYR
jgi:hypothetical protein